MPPDQRAALERLTEQVGVPAVDLDNDLAMGEVHQRHIDYAMNGYVPYPAGENPTEGDWLAFGSYLHAVRRWVEGRGISRFVDDPLGPGG
jgi:hypothetical protein